jgi:glycosyltransferase involved in cell wall biosynthesis
VGKILFVAFPFSIHTARWINQLSNGGFEVHLYSSHRGAQPHDQLSKDVIWHSNPKNLQRRRSFAERLYRKIKPVITKSPAQELTDLIKIIQPDIINSLESQHAGYLVSTARENFSDNDFPFWMHSNWGIDLHFFGRIKEHIPKLKKMLTGIDHLITEGERDTQLAQNLGYKNATSVFPSVGGGFVFPAIAFTVPSARNIILVKGTQDIVRRGLCAIRALERCKDVLGNYEIVLYSSCDETRVAAEFFQENTGKEIKLLSNVSQNEMLNLAASSRISLCTNMSDGLPNAMLEAMMMGAFPVQSDTCISEGWIQDSKTGFLVPPEDTDVIAAKLRTALTDDQLVDNAAAINMQLIRSSLDYDTIKASVTELYQKVLQLKKS